jgi:hypothetical protein
LPSRQPWLYPWNGCTFIVYFSNPSKKTRAVRQVAYVLSIALSGCADDAAAERCALPTGDYRVEATLASSLSCGFASAGTFYQSFSSGTRDYPGMHCSVVRSASEDLCSLTLEERCVADAGAPRATHLTTYHFGSSSLSGTRYTFVDSASGSCTMIETLHGVPN